jgi:uncharacterized C2H2 Zn-finger protein
MDLDHRPLLPRPSTPLPLMYACHSCPLTFDTSDKQIRHKSEAHSTLNPVLMPDGSEFPVVREPDGHLTCPALDCTKRYLTRTSYVKHIQSHGLKLVADKPATDKPGPGPPKRAAEPEHHGSGHHKKARFAVTEASGPLGALFAGAPRAIEAPSGHADPTPEWSPPQPPSFQASRTSLVLSLRCYVLTNLPPSLTQPGSNSMAPRVTS